MDRPRGFVNVDQLQAETTLEAAALKCGVLLNATGSGPEVRIDCPFGCPGDHVSRKEISINTANAEKVFCCHSYQCQFRGNMLALMHGWLNGSKPSDGKLRGAEFQRVRDVLSDRTQIAPQSRAVTTPTTPANVSVAVAETEAVGNVPLIDAENDAVRELANIDAKFVVDIAAMNPAASSYIRRHPCLTPESMRKWRAGYLPHDGGGDKRGWSLRGHIVYPVCAEDGKVLAWAGRDPLFEQKLAEYEAIRPELRGGKPPPMKHKFPKGFHRGQELFGQHASRLKEPDYREAIARHGIIVVEGFNDVIGLDNVGVPAVAICSNRITEAQVTKIAGWAELLADHKVTLLFDCEQSGDDGAKEALWLFAQRGLDVRLGWSQTMHGAAFKSRQPESLSSSEWNTAIRSQLER